MRAAPGSLRTRPPAAETVPFADLSRQWRQIEPGAMSDLRKLFETSAFILGPFVERFEKAAAEYLGVAHAVGVNSGTSALHLALIAAGIGPGDKVLLPANTFIATAWSVLYVGAEPVLCDVEPASWTIDLADAERRLSAAVKAIIPVHLYGQPADMDRVTSFAARHGLVVVEDAAQAFGARCGNRHAGSLGRLGCFSFYPAKSLGAAGEGGMITTAEATLAERLRRLRHHAQSERYVHSELGFNYRMEGVQGIVLWHKLPHVDAWAEERRGIARRYGEGLADTSLELPQVRNGDHVWHLYVVHSERRDALRAHLAAHGIETGLHYPVPLHRQPCLAHLRLDRESFPVTDRNARQCLSLPIFAGMSEAETDRVIRGVRDFYGMA